MQTIEKSYTIKTINESIRNGNVVFNHPMQRKPGQWDNEQQSLLINSLLGGYAVPQTYAIPLFEGDFSCFSVLDGKQRFTTIYDYMQGDFKLSENTPSIYRKNKKIITDENGKPQAVNVSVIQKVKYAVKLSKLTFKDFGVDVQNNVLDVPKCENHDEYCIFKFENEEELRDSICRYVCTSGKYPCGVAVLRKNNQVLISYSDTEKPTEICRFQNYGIKDAPKDQQYLAVGELLTKTYGLGNYGIMVELEDSFYQAIME